MSKRYNPRMMLAFVGGRQMRRNMKAAAFQRLCSIHRAEQAAKSDMQICRESAENMEDCG